MPILKDALSSNFPDFLYVDWQLAKAVNHSVPYELNDCSEYVEHYSIEPLLHAAYKFMSLNRKDYFFRLYGGEPTLNPFLPELLAYLFSTRGNSHIRLETNGLIGIDYFIPLLKIAPKNHLYLSLNIHLQYWDIKQLLIFIAHIHESGQNCGVILHQIPTDAEKGWHFFNVLLEFQKTIPFTLNIVFPLGSVAGATDKTVHKPQAMTFPDWTEINEPVQTNGYCCCGTVSANVDTQGLVGLGVIGQELPFAPVVLASPILFPGLPIPPCFSTQEEAQTWIKEFEVWSLRTELSGGPTRNPIVRNFEEEELRSAIMLLKPGEKHGKADFAHPGYWNSHLHKIISIFEGISSEAEKHDFLNLLLRFLFGDARFWPSKNGTIKSISGFLQPKYALTITDAPELLNSLQWSNPPFRLPIPQNADWLDALYFLSQNLSNYNLCFATDDNIAYLAGIPSIMDFFCKDGDTDGAPVISFIISAGENDGLLSLSSLKNVLQNLDCEVIIAVENSETENYKKAIDLERRLPSRVRIYDSGKAGDIPNMLPGAFACARGRYAFLARAEDELNIPGITSALQAMQSDPSIKMALGTKKIVPHILDKAELKTLTGDPSIWRNGMLFDAKAVRNENIFPSEPMADVPSDLFFIPLLVRLNRILYGGHFLTPEYPHPQLNTSIGRSFAGAARFIKKYIDAFGHDDSYSVFDSWLTDYLRNWRGEIVSGQKMNILDENLAETSAPELLTLQKFPALMRELCPIKEKNSSAIKEGTWSKPIFSCAHSPGDIEYSFTVIVCLQGAVSQMYARSLFERISENGDNFECLVFDKTNDNALKRVLASYEAIFPNYRVFSATNHARYADIFNEGLKQANGKYVAFLDDCDIPTPEFMEAGFKAESENMDILIMGAQRVAYSGTVEFPFFDECSLSGEEAIGILLKNFSPLDLTAKFLRKDRLIKNGISFSPFIGAPEAAFIIDAAQNASVVIKPQCAVIREEKKRMQDSPLLCEAALTDENALFAKLDVCSLNGKWTTDINKAADLWCRNRIQQFWAPLSTLSSDDSVKFHYPNSAMFMRALISDYIY